MTNLAKTELWDLIRDSRFVYTNFKKPHKIVSTSYCNSGLVCGIPHILNYQSCENIKDHSRCEKLVLLSLKEIHQLNCKEASLDPNLTISMGTAADMNNIMVETLSYKDLEVTAIVTAGVKGNAARAGDPASYMEIPSAKGNHWQNVYEKPGTINIIVLINKPLHDAALTRAISTINEAKAVVLQNLLVPSISSNGIATGSGTDQYAIAAPMLNPKNSLEFEYTWSGHHSKLGELIANSVILAITKSLKRQNGFTPESTRNIYHLLKRFGVNKKTLKKELSKYLKDDGAYLENDITSIIYSDQLSICALAMANIEDSINIGRISFALADEARLRQVANMVCHVSSKNDLYAKVREELTVVPNNLISLFALGIHLAWKYKWSN